MPRIKTYNEQEVIEKAMNLFWRNGYKTTSMQMLEKEMGINKFSIYSSFGNKNGVFIAVIKCYKQKLNKFINKLTDSSNGVDGIKEYFYDFVDFSKEYELCKGCLITNTANEIGQDANDELKNILSTFTGQVREAFALSLRQDKTKDNATIEAQADYLIIAMFGFSSATKMFGQSQLDNYIENIFKNL